MVHLREMPDHLREALINQELPEYGDTPWTTPKPVDECRVALISTAGLHRREDDPFAPGAGDYRIIPDEYDMNNLVMSHLSTNFDRSGFYQDVNTSFPVDRLRELADEGVVSSVASRHFSFMGATPPTVMEPIARDLANVLKADNVDAVVLVPV
ncbi:MAG: selenoprotein B glycine/betaine/sarcosine/D-proline reductase [Alphaproteobacteria bacterium]|nr:selenoprotein B glycine/betaine/sarcosine/D-proline reductase [Alphaproteobacteria bacterium]HCP00524.1 selenoprotein B glycine/betaine/sarcosine/D-proline reductase [Rhodospirillaceae bacterium]